MAAGDFNMWHFSLDGLVYRGRALVDDPWVLFARISPLSFGHAPKI